jgi:hypothetical protein
MPTLQAPIMTGQIIVVVIVVVVVIIISIISLMKKQLQRVCEK